MKQKAGLAVSNRNARDDLTPPHARDCKRIIHLGSSKPQFGFFVLCFATKCLSLQGFYFCVLIMNIFHRLLPLVVFACVYAAASASERAIVVDLWPNGTPDKSTNPLDTAKLYVYLPEVRQLTGRAIVICPGGAYSGLAMGHEGTDWVDFFNGQGIAVMVLKYRLPHGNHEIPVQDAMEAMRVVRRNAATWHVDPNQVGIMGSSAGGHLASVVATMGKADAMPNFQILFYPVITMDPGFTHRGTHDNFLGKSPRKKMEQEYSTDRQVSRVTPRAFIALSDDDHSVLPANSVNYYLACYRHDVPATLHVYPKGGHGWGMKQSFPFHIEMLLDLKAWLSSF